MLVAILQTLHVVTGREMNSACPKFGGSGTKVTNKGWWVEDLQVQMTCC